MKRFAIIDAPKALRIPCDGSRHFLLDILGNEAQAHRPAALVAVFVDTELVRCFAQFLDVLLEPTVGILDRLGPDAEQAAQGLVEAVLPGLIGLKPILVVLTDKTRIVRVGDTGAGCRAE